MELRPRRGRSAQPLPSPTIAKPSPRPPPQSSSRKKPAPGPPTSILILSDDEDSGSKEIRRDRVGAEISVAAVPLENGDRSLLKQDHKDGSEFEVPLSSIVKLRRAQKKLASSDSKSKNKVTSSVKKKEVVGELGCTPVAERAFIANDRVASASEEAGVDVAHNEEDALEETKKQEVLTSSVPQNSSELAVEITITELCSKKVEVLNPSGKGNKMHSKKKKSAKKRDEESEVIDAKLDWVDAQEHVVDVNAPISSESQALSLVLSDDETENALREEGCTGTFAARALEKSSSVAEVSKASSIGKNSQPYKKGVMKGDNLSQKLFEGTNDITISSTDMEVEDQIRHGLGSIAKPSKESAIVEVEKFAEIVNSASKSHNFQLPSTDLREREVTNLVMFDSDKDKLDTPETGVQDGVEEVSEESLDEAVTLRDDDISSDCAKLDVTMSSSQENAMHVKECCRSDDDSGSASSGSDDDNEDEMASAFFSSMKAHLQRISGSSCSKLSMQKGTHAKQEAFGRTDSESMIKKPCANGRLTDHGLSWCPEVVVSASKISKAQAGKPLNNMQARPDTIWGRDRCLQDGLCVPPMDPLKLNKLARKQKDNTAGAKWFNLSAPTITPELKKELQLLKLRGVLDPKRHYKAEDSKGLPRFFQVGTVVGGPADFYSGRLTKKEQKSSLANELLSDSSLTVYRKRKYMEIQNQKQAGGKGFWKKKKSKRTPAWAKI